MKKTRSVLHGDGIAKRSRSIRRVGALDASVITLFLFVTVLAVFGGSSRYDQLAQIPVRLMALTVIIVATFRPARAVPKTLIIPWILLLCAVVLVCVQLIPLPPHVWAALPGRAKLADGILAAGLNQAWHPLALAPDLTVNALLSLTVPVAVFYGLSTVRQDYWRWINSVILLIVLISLIVGLIQLTTGMSGFTAVYNFQYDGTAPGLFVNRNHQALLLAMGLPLLAGSEQLRSGNSRSGIANWVSGAFAMMLCLTLVVTGSRAGALLGALSFAGAVGVFWSWYKVRSHASQLLQWLVVLRLAVPTVIVVSIAALFGRGEAINRLFSTDPLADQRARSLPTVIDLLQAYFPAGSGFGSFDVAFRRAEPFSLLDVRYFNQAHNDLLQVMIEGGLPGAILLTAAICWFAYAGSRIWARGGAHRTIVRGRAASIALLLVGVASAVDYPVRTPILMAVTSALFFQMAVALSALEPQAVEKPVAG